MGGVSRPLEMRLLGSVRGKKWRERGGRGRRCVSCTQGPPWSLPGLPAMRAWRRNEVAGVEFLVSMEEDVRESEV